MKNLDLSKFKKVSQDKNSAVLKHPDGHEFKVAVSNLNASLKKELEKLPLHQAEPEKVVEAIDEDSPAQASDVPEPSDPTEEEMNEAAKEAPAPEAPQQPVAQVQSPAAQLTVPQGAPQPQAPIAPAPQAPQPAPEVIAQTPEEEAKQMTAHNIAFADDMRAGKITPKTYSDLFAEKSTLGKIGTIFGLMLSGAGSGLTHQPNALLAMMDKQIERDLEAQKQNQANKQTWYRAALEHERMLPENALRLSQASEAASKADFERWKNAQAGVEDMSATNNALNMQRAATVQSMQNIINTMPAGPQRDAAQLQLDNNIAPFFLNKAATSNLDTAQKKAVANTINVLPTKKANPPPKGDALPGAKYDAVNEDKLTKMIQKGKFAPESADAVPPNLLGEVNKEKAELTVNRNNLADADDSFNNLAKLNRAGQVPGSGSASNLVAGLGSVLGFISGGPIGAGIGATAGKLATAIPGETIKEYFERNRAIQVEALKSRLGSNMSEDDKNKLANALLPNWADNPESMAEAHRKMVQHFESNAAETAPNLTRLGLKYPMPKYKFTNPKEEKKDK